MLILNINGPINSGKSTVSKLLVQMLPHAVFIEVDDLVSDDEEKKLGLTMQAGWGQPKKSTPIRNNYFCVSNDRKFVSAMVGTY